MHYEDLSEYKYYLTKPLKNVINIGWLNSVSSHTEKPFYKSEGFLLKLKDIIIGNSVVNAHVNLVRSTEPCLVSGCEPIWIENDESKCCLGASEIWIPTTKKGFYFASPSMIYHYISDHNYIPPKAYIDAVIRFDLAKKYNAQKIYLIESNKK
ncbi:hypothetical protein TW85_23030 [Marinomonas sp. S3726]|uniref:DUF7919 family protein n=1 Tax=Marinomonas sp. S3726 TaxID=579484 RepID=UPI0005F9B363|nr:hypothetical protein [Marinomonas sp. S3726]KJZ08911.1 hypothetical protein TW85_23030 [Marinomonas sp. S3726]